jgi:hypothetical protein
LSATAAPSPNRWPGVTVGRSSSCTTEATAEVRIRRGRMSPRGGQLRFDNWLQPPILSGYSKGENQ